MNGGGGGGGGVLEGRRQRKGRVQEGMWHESFGDNEYACMRNDLFGAIPDICVHRSLVNA